MNGKKGHKTEEDEEGKHLNLICLMNMKRNKIKWNDSFVAKINYFTNL